MALVPEPTLDQNAVRDAVVSGSSLRVIAHAGTGKTSTLLWSFTGLTRKVLFLEYNRDLRLEARENARASGLSHVVVHNYDSFLLEFYDPTAPSRDFQLALQRVLREDLNPREAFAFETIVVDEAQDMTVPYALFLQKIFRDNGFKTPQLVLAGDPKQTIYAFRGATNDYLVGEWDWAGARGPPIDLALAETFRFGDGLCGFVNSFCPGLFKKGHWGVDIVSGFQGGTVELWSLNIESTGSSLIDTYLRAAAEGSVCLLASSVREDNLLLSAFVELASLAGMAPSEDERAMYPVLRTVHTSKGKQYRTVLVFMSQEDMWLTPTGRLKGDKNTLLYVGCTRARERLIFVEASDERLFTKMLGRFCKPGIPIPQARCASTGGAAPDAAPSGVLRMTPSVARASLSVLDKKLSIEDKESILESVSFCVNTSGPKLDETSSDEELLVRARASWNSSRTDTSNPLWPLLIWATNGQPVAARVAYARLGRTRHRYLETFEASLTQLPRELSKWEDWATLARFHPERRYGHSAPRGFQPNLESCQALYASFIDSFGFFEKVPPADLCSVSASFTTCSHDHVFYLDQQRRAVMTPIFCVTEATRPTDVFACILAASRLNRRFAGIVYLQRGVEVMIRVTEAAATKAEKMATRMDRWA